VLRQSINLVLRPDSTFPTDFCSSDADSVLPPEQPTEEKRTREPMTEIQAVIFIKQHPLPKPYGFSNPININHPKSTYNCIGQFGEDLRF
jgi:hypothetical protein